MTWTTIAHGPDGTVLCWHVGDVARQLADALPGWTVRVASGPSTPAPVTPGRVVLVGYSAGCQGVRAALLGPIPSPCAVVTIDGTHASLPPAPWQLEVWRALAERARARECLWLATCLAAHRYVERIPAGQPGRAMATVSVLERATGLVLRREPTRPPSGLVDGRVTGRPAECGLADVVDDGGLRVRSYLSADTDHAEHEAQLTRVLPDLWRTVVVPWLVAGRADTDPAPPPSDATPVPTGDEPVRLGLRCLAWLGVEAVAGVRELPGPRHDPRILGYSRDCRRGGTLVGVEPRALVPRGEGGLYRPAWVGGVPLPLPRDEDAWCAAIQSAALAASLVPGEAPPHGLRVSVRELVEDARAVGALRLVGSGYEPRPGDLAVTGRAGGDPLRGGTGHVHRVVQVDGPRYLAIGGNEGDTVRVDWHPRARVLAWVAYP